MLSDAYFLAKFRFDTAENEPAKNLQNFRKMYFRKRNAEVLREQIAEKQTRRELRLAEQRGEAHGYCGPDEHEPEMALPSG